MNIFKLFSLLKKSARTVQRVTDSFDSAVNFSKTLSPSFDTSIFSLITQSIHSRFGENYLLVLLVVLLKFAILAVLLKFLFSFPFMLLAPL